MNKKTIIFLCVLIVLMLGVIVAGVSYLYSSPAKEVKVTDMSPVKEALAKVDKQLADESELDNVKEEGQDKTAVDEQKAAEEAKKAEEAAKAEAAKKAEEAQKAEETRKAEEAKKAEAAKKTAASEWKVKNSGTGKVNTLRQNADNSLSLIDHNGSSLWKISFPGKVVGDPAQIDIYNNLKIQFLIAENSKLHLIDRLGREVKGFPINLPGAAKSGPKDVKSGNVVYWKIECAKGPVYFDKKTKTILNQLPN